jgi:hypothetical protein
MAAVPPEVLYLSHATKMRAIFASIERFYRDEPLRNEVRR